MWKNGEIDMLITAIAVLFGHRPATPDTGFIHFFLVAKSFR
jgi:hypothetical protein